MQNKGLTAILLNSMTESARKNNVKYAETGPELETNNRYRHCGSIMKPSSTNADAAG